MASLRDARKTLPCSFTGTILSVLAFSLSLPLGILLADLLLRNSGFTLSVQPADPYAGCGFAAEYAVRAAFLCLPTILQTTAVWLSAYVRFEKILLISLFALRGLSLGTALRLVLLLEADPPVLGHLLAYGVISLILLGMVFCVRGRECVRPFPDSLTVMLIAGGASTLTAVLASLLYRIL